MENLSELRQYHFPNLSPEQLREEPYLSYTQIYCSLSATLKFYRGFVRPSSIFQAKIYRAVRLAYGSHHREPPTDSCMVFRSPHGLVIKVREIPPDFDRLFDLYLTQPDSCVFLPEGYHRLGRYEFPYYHDLLFNFKQNHPELHRTSALIRCSENNSEFLFLCLEQPSPVDLSSDWRSYLQGGLERTITLTAGQVPEALLRFGWTERTGWSVQGDRAKLTVRCSSREEFTERTHELPERANWTLLDLGRKIENEQEAVGLIRRVGQVIPLLGTSWVALPQTLVEKTKLALSEQHPLELPEGSEVFTQIEFSEMSALQKSSLIQAPNGNYYCLLGLIQQASSIDPLTRQPYPEEFVQQIQRLRQELEGPFLTGFPPAPFDPQLITICPDGEEADRSISFYLQLMEDTHLFWRIPDLRRTEFAPLTIEAIRVLVTKWTDRSLFKGYRPERRINPNLLFSPAAYYVFEKSSQELELGRVPTELREQADRLREQIYILQTQV